MIKPEWDSQNRTTRTGQAERTDRTGLPAHLYQDSTARTGHLEQDSQDRIAGIGQTEKGQPQWDRKMMACRSEMPGQDCQYSIATIELPGQDSRAGIPRQDFQDMTTQTVQPEQILL
jgi:hypothetical protein